MVVSVSQLNEYVRRTLASDPMLRSLSLRGEISNFKRHAPSGHLYFSLKDEGARIACVMFRQHAFDLRMEPRDGMRVVLEGSVSLYAQTGQYQFCAQSMRPDGVGDLYLRFEQLKAALQQEGLFDASLKKPLPLLPRTVGVVTSATGAAVRDIISVATRRNPGVRLLLCPASVQGEAAPGEIVRALRTLDALDSVDVIIVGRGGGSLEELWAFNEEAVARAIFACKKPVVSAVGHETDFTIADFVADLRAPTPSAAAERVVPSGEELSAALDGSAMLLDQRMRVRLQGWSARMAHAHAVIQAYGPARALERRREQLLHARTLLDTHMARACKAREEALRSARGRLDALSPKGVLARGYAYVTRAGRPARRLAIGDRITLHLAAGQAQAEVKDWRDAHACEEKGKADV
ncbi:MAG TPA: exodeoxyribonuclease VII large subunit [Candidatus Onthenecus intestinigallinarum]|uniref:Exodeoxyribonuclease 7 large subunit n=1 Tax=Candidatus Onthenecus intestinigallinarum TaxID=2840875 RepID=A0A9D0Z9R9_9FIRM|nr:exodeoxyribonuclease VII large subunit [Candidatus Onthenecus intestinigallinarum]